MKPAGRTLGLANQIPVAIGPVQKNWSQTSADVRRTFVLALEHEHEFDRAWLSDKFAVT